MTDPNGTEKLQELRERFRVDARHWRALRVARENGRREPGREEVGRDLARLHKREVECELPLSAADNGELLLRGPRREGVHGVACDRRGGRLQEAQLQPLRGAQ